MIYNIHSLCFHAVIASGLKKFEENLISNLTMEQVTRNGSKNLIHIAFHLIIFEFGVN